VEGLVDGKMRRVQEESPEKEEEKFSIECYRSGFLKTRHAETRQWDRGRGQGWDYPKDRKLL
jgi:hypothetical protein